MRFLLVRSSKYNILYTQSNYQAKYFLRHIGTQSIDTFNSSLSRQKISSSNQFFFFNYYTTQTHLKSNVEFLFPVYFLGNALGNLKIPAFHSVLLSSKIYEEGRFQNSEFRDTIIVTGHYLSVTQIFIYTILFLTLTILSYPQKSKIFTRPNRQLTCSALKRTYLLYWATLWA